MAIYTFWRPSCLFNTAHESPTLRSGLFEGFGNKVTNRRFRKAPSDHTIAASRKVLVIVLVLLPVQFGFADCGLLILNYKHDLLFQGLYPFEQISYCGRATNSVLGKVDPQ